MRPALLAMVLVSEVASAGPRPRVPTPPAHYAKLFDATATWTYEVASAGAPAAVVTCKVARVAAFPGVLASEVTCEGDTWGDAFPVPDTYLATASGLYRSSTGFPESAAAVEPFSLHQLLIGASPKVTASTVTRYAIVDHVPVPVATTFGTRRETRGAGAAATRTWCWYRRTRFEGTTRTDTRCFDGGIVSGVEGPLAFQVR